MADGSRASSSSTSRALRDGSGLVLVVSAVGVLGIAVWTLLEHDYLGAMMLSMVGLAILRAAVSLLRPSIGE